VSGYVAPGTRPVIMLAAGRSEREANMGLAEDELRAIETRWLSEEGSPEARTLDALVDQASIDVALLVAEIRRLQTELRLRDRA
jgi:hypothetical protein